MVTNPFRKTY